ncbi:protein DA1-like isoform X3 [Argentina anserina]|uniref:protein DA1-like isoform X1 n=1 Tax=Argentina anserina TaxID=57926 RepID=UPI00217629C0|nr:protein DA1-like isoform X1 [Potentilla anserina]XP_050377854.1 protein DA1-like isoform X2 [Potentilla anserina]XP_050377855.1 protein DA1-like isoform X2 [Potentilla anserina]XP_050377856.1 protein DA1-like isoform X3 [Potentilla anserina]
MGHAILMLFGKPDIEMGAILSHEMMHAWFHLQGIAWGYEKSSVEGLCEVMAYKWLEWFTSSGLGNSHKTNQQIQYTRELKEFLVEKKWDRGDDVYGQGFRDAMRAIEIYGFEPTLDYVVRHGTLPPLMRDNTFSAAASASAYAAAMATSTTKSLLKDTGNITRGKVIGATIFNFIWKAATTFKAPRVGFLIGQLGFFVVINLEHK